MDIYIVITIIVLTCLIVYFIKLKGIFEKFSPNRTDKPVINGEDKTQYLNSKADTIYCIGPETPPDFSLGLKTMVVKPFPPEKAKADYEIENPEICNSAANTLTHLECIRNYVGTSGEKHNTCCIISTVVLEDRYRELWRESLEKVCENAPSNWDIIVLAYDGKTPLPNMYVPFSPELDVKVYIIRSECCSTIMKQMYIADTNSGKKFNIVLHDINTVGLHKTLFESFNTFVYKYPFFPSHNPDVRAEQDNLMFDRDSDIYKSAEIVVARYNEPLDWLKKYPYNKVPVVVYNKGNNDNYFKSPNIIREINLPNLGKCDHTYIHHIVDNYDKLKDITVFLTGSLDVLQHKLVNSTKIIESLDRDLRSTMVVQYHSDIRKSLHDFILNSHVSNDRRNAGGVAKLYPSETRPFGKWFEKKFGDLVVNAVSYYGILSVSRDHIRNRNLDFYKELLRELSVSQNPEVGHYVERAWIAIFHPMKGVKFLK